MKDYMRTVFVYFIVWKTLLAQVKSQQSCGPIRSDSKCTITIETWNDFKKEINNSNPSSPLIFCPFSIKKEDTAAFVISNKVEAICEKEGQCVIDASPSGGATIIRIRGSNAKVNMHGFVFENSGNVFAAVHITFGTSLDQLFCRCIFRR
jgi:hypothetical protein